MPASDLPLASLSVDLDNLWSYMKIHGDPGWERFPSFLDIAVPRMLDVLSELNLRSTVFVVGKDASLEKNHLMLRQITMYGHELGNNSFSHEPWFHRYTREQIEREVELAELWIEEVTGLRPRGWRGPGFSFSPALLEVLAERGYDYDATTFPTFLGPVARTLHLMNSGLSRKDRRKRSRLYGGWRDGARPLRPFQWNLGNGSKLLEIPVTTVPMLRLPMHGSYLLYLAKHNGLLARNYFGMAMNFCKWTRATPSFLLHPTDFLGADDVPELRYLPAMDQSSLWKMRNIRNILRRFAKNFDVVTVGEQAARLGPRMERLPQRTLQPVAA